MKKPQSAQLSELVDMNSPAAVFEEVKNNFIRHYPIADFLIVRVAFNDFNDLYDGKYPGYRACNTKFHDKIHTADALLAISRLIDGYNTRHPRLPLRLVKIALIATILHDSGYVQKSRDKVGTGAKYTLMHVERSIEFIKTYFRKIGFSPSEALAARNMVHCTGLENHIPDIRFGSRPERILGFMLGTADLIGQMASRTYLERLLYLYREFKEGHVKGYNSEYELLSKTIKFYASMKKRIADDLLGLDKYARVHFRTRYGIDENLYDSSMKHHLEYLSVILADRKDSYRHKLRRQLS